MGTPAQRKISLSYYRRHREEQKKKMKERYQKHKKEECDRTHDRYIQTREGMYKWHYKTVTGYLPYAQGNKKEK